MPLMWSKLATLEVTIDDVDLLHHELPLPAFKRLTTVVRLAGDGHEGRGEDVAYDPIDQERFRQASIDWPTGAFDLGSFSKALDAVELFTHEPQQQAYRDYRRWAVESAALDLALHQAGLNLHDVLGRTPAPLRFVASSGVGHPPSMEAIERVRRRAPASRFKLDVNAGWTQEFLDELAPLGIVDVVDLKGAYKGTPVDTPADPELYRRVAETLPDAFIEDPAWNERTAAVLEAHRDRVTWDAPIHGVPDIEALPFQPRVINIKPSRCGKLETLCAVYEYCERHGIGMYGGGQFELGVGRAQIQALASMFHADAGNDCSPTEYHDAGAHDSLPASPLASVTWP